MFGSVMHETDDTIWRHTYQSVWRHIWLQRSDAVDGILRENIGGDALATCVSKP